ALDYLLGNFPRAMEHVQRASALLPLTTASVAGRGTIAWTYALLHRQRNDLLEALREVEAAAALYRQLGATDSTCRVLGLAAEIALDLAESSAEGAPSARAEYQLLAARYMEEALWVGKKAGDAAGVELASLSFARLEQLQGIDQAMHAEPAILGVLQQARRMHDDSLRCTAQTALGINLLARGERAAGTRWLRKAIATA